MLQCATHRCNPEDRVQCTKAGKDDNDDADEDEEEEDEDDPVVKAAFKKKNKKPAARKYFKRGLNHSTCGCLIKITGYEKVLDPPPRVGEKPKYHIPGRVNVYTKVGIGGTGHFDPNSPFTPAHSHKGGVHDGQDEDGQMPKQRTGTSPGAGASIPKVFDSEINTLLQALSRLYPPHCDASTLTLNPNPNPDPASAGQEESTTSSLQPAHQVSTALE